MLIFGLNPFKNALNENNVIKLAFFYFHLFLIDSQGSFQHRTLLHSEGKMRVARKALQFLQPGQTIVLDGSSTSWFLARQMPEMALTVITPSIRILQTLISRRSLHLVGLGGDFSPTEESFFGETASRTIGNDTFGHFARRHLKGVGFNAVTLLVAEEIPTGNALIYVAGNDAENMIAVDPGANMTVTDDEIAGCIPAIGCADVVLVQLENNLSAIEQVVDAGKQAGALVMLNPAPWQPVERALLSKVDLLTPNATEAGLMTGRRVDSLAAAAEAADVLHAQGARNVIITLGASGALLSEQGVKSRVPCFPSHPRDTTGAGDAFNGALAARLACGEPLQAAARFAAAYAAVSVEKQGASSLPEYLEAQERLLRAAADYEMA